jgi:predicted ATP-grasp superfamily ATP-dependent carboligase
MAQGVRLLKKLKWRGVAQVEYLEDERDGVLKLMEINPRFWDSLQTVIQAGVDFPHLLYQISTEGDVDPELEYRSGEICRSMLPGEILYFLANFKHLRTDPSFWKFRGSNLGYCILNRKDIRPAFAFFGIAIKSLFDRDVRDTVFHRI